MERPKVLIAEDSASVRRGLERALAARSMDVSSVDSGAEALERLSSEAPDLVICDLALPDADGYAICERVRHDPRLLATRVVLTSAMVSGVVLERAARAGSACVVFKPVAPEDLADRAAELLGLGGATAPAAFVLAPLDLAAPLARLRAIPGVRSAALVDRDGFVIETTGDMDLTDETAAALAASLGDLGEFGSRFGEGALDSVVLAYQSSLLVLQSAGMAGTLAVFVADPSALGTVLEGVKALLAPLTSTLSPLTGGGA